MYYPFYKRCYNGIFLYEKIETFDEGANILILTGVHGSSTGNVSKFDNQLQEQLEYVIHTFKAQNSENKSTVANAVKGKAQFWAKPSRSPVNKFLQLTGMFRFTCKH